MTRADLLTRLARRLGKNTTLDTATQNRLLDFLNERHRRLLSMPGLRQFRDETVTVASTASDPLIALPNVAEVHRIFETTNDRVLERISMEQYRAIDPDPASAEGTPWAYAVKGYQQVAKAPADASELFLKSTSASDTQVAYVEGEITGGYPRSASVTLTGTSAVSLSASITTWVRVTKVYLASAAVGVVTLHEDSGSGTELARIGIGQTQQRYWTAYLVPTPSSAITYSCDVTLALTDLAQDTDEPRLPEDFHDLLLLGALMDEYQHLNDDRYVAAAREYQERVNDLRLRVARQSLGGAPLAAASTLGAWYPAGT